MDGIDVDALLAAGVPRERIEKAMADRMGATPFDMYRNARDQVPADNQEQQAQLANLEHNAFARPWTGENPLAAVSLAGAIPAYQLAKVLGMVKGRSGSEDPMGQMAAAYKGIGQGLGDYFRGN